jgi:hypothetical protein
MVPWGPVRGGIEQSRIADHPASAVQALDHAEEIAESEIRRQQ